MALSIHSGSWITYDEANSLYTRIAGVTAGTSTTDNGQAILAGVNRACQYLLTRLRERGFSVAQIATIGNIKEMQLHLSAYYWLRDPSLRFDVQRFEPVIVSYREEIEAFLAEGSSYYTAAGVYLDPDEAAAGAAQHQARYSVQNNSAGENHLFRFDADPEQFLSGASSKIVAGSKYPNPS